MCRMSVFSFIEELKTIEIYHQLKEREEGRERKSERGKTKH